MTPSELRTARLALGLSQQELADALGVSRETVARWESGKRDIPPLLDARAAVTVLRLQDALA